MFDLLSGFVNYFWWRLFDLAYAICISVPRFVQSNQGTDVEIVFVREGIFLVDNSIFVIEYLWVPCINNVLNRNCVLIHLSLYVILSLALGVFTSFDAIDPHHILFANLIEAIPHFDLQLIFKPLKSLDLHKLDVF
jgi:hypothetical protein